jgi:hypothetical protein
MLLPKEHGAYSQMLFPLVTSLVVTGLHTAPLLLAAAVVAGFLAHEPFMVLLGFRGVRARREQRREAMAGLMIFGLLLAAAGLAALAMMPGHTGWSVILPLVPAAFLLVEAASGREKAWPAEVAVATAFSLTAIPVCLASGAPFAAGAAIAAAFGVDFVLATLGVRVVILRVRAGGNIAAAMATRNAALALAAIVLAAGAAVLAARVAPVLAVATLVPAAVPGVVVAWQAPPPARLRQIGWTLVGTSTLIGVMLVGAFRVAP